MEQCRLVHQSAKDFLFSNSKMPDRCTTKSWYHLDLASATRIIANKCISFLHLEDFSQLRMDANRGKYLNSIIVRPDVLRSKLHECCKEHPFLDYALHHWPHHFREYEQLQTSLKSVMYDPTNMHDPTDLHDPTDPTDMHDPTNAVASLYNYTVPLRAHWFMKMLRLTDMPLDQEECQISPIVFCAYNGHTSVMPRLMSRMDVPDINAPISQMKFSALHAAALGKHLLMVDWLLTNGAYVQATDAWNRTPLHIAARRNNEDILRCLLHHHADTSAKDKFGMTPIQGAHERGFSENVKIPAQQSGDADPILLVMPDLDQTQDGQARHSHDMNEIDLEEFDLEDPYQPLHDVAQQFADELTGRSKDDGGHSSLSFPKLVHTSGSSDSSERRSLSLFSSESSLTGSRRSLSRARSRNHITPSKHGSFRRSSSVGSHCGKSRSGLIDLQFERDKENRYQPSALTENDQISRQSSSIDLDAPVLDEPVYLQAPTIVNTNQETILDSKESIPVSRETILDSKMAILAIGKSYSSDYEFAF